MVEKELVSIVKCKDYDRKRVRKAMIDSLKNINFHFKPGMRVLIKPNLLSATLPEKAITTNPVLIEELCKILKEQKAEIIIGESSSMDTDQAFETCGINKLKKYAKIVNFEAENKKDFNLGHVHRTPLPKILFNVDLVINFAKMKTHGFTLVTLCVKNLYGCIPGRLKEQYHRLLKTPKIFSKFLVRLHDTINPRLNIIDGVIGIEGNGPGSAGIIIKPELIITSRNAYAADIVATEVMGFKPKSVYTNKLSGLKRGDIASLGNGKDIKLQFKKPSNFTIPFLLSLSNIFPKPRINFDKKLCQRCHLCEEKCPEKAISLKTEDGFPQCNYKKCICCLCCIEVCPHRAVHLKEHWTLELLKRIGKKIIKY